LLRRICISSCGCVELPAERMDHEEEGQNAGFFGSSVLRSGITRPLRLAHGVEGPDSSWTGSTVRTRAMSLSEGPCGAGSMVKVERCAPACC